MGYRDEHEALRAKADALEAEVQTLRKKAERLQREKDDAVQGNLSSIQVVQDPARTWWGVPGIESTQRLEVSLDNDGRMALAETVRDELVIETTLGFSEIGGRYVLAATGPEGAKVLMISSPAGTNIQVSLRPWKRHLSILFAAALVAVALTSRNLLVIAGMLFGLGWFRHRRNQTLARRREQRLRQVLSLLAETVHAHGVPVERAP